MNCIIVSHEDARIALMQEALNAVGCGNDVLLIPGSDAIDRILDLEEMQIALVDMHLDLDIENVKGASVSSLPPSISVIRMVRQMYPESVIVAVTKFNCDGDEIAAMEAGADDSISAVNFIKKKTGIGILVNLIRKNQAEPGHEKYALIKAILENRGSGEAA